MGIDIVCSCPTQSETSGHQGFFLGLILLFSTYILFDSVISGAAIRAKLMTAKAAKDTTQHNLPMSTCTDARQMSCSPLS
jgi:hypothetical protein